MSGELLTTRRAVLLRRGAAVPGRIRVGTEAVEFTPADGATLRVRLAEVRRVTSGRREFTVHASGGILRVRCFGARGVALLLSGVLTHEAARRRPGRLRA